MRILYFNFVVVVLHIFIRILFVFIVYSIIDFLCSLSQKYYFQLSNFTCVLWYYSLLFLCECYWIWLTSKFVRHKIVSYANTDNITLYLHRICVEQTLYSLLCFNYISLFRLQLYMTDSVYSMDYGTK